MDMFTGYDAALLFGILIGVGLGFLIAMWFQTSIVLKFKDELVDWISSEELDQGEQQGWIPRAVQGFTNPSTAVEEAYRRGVERGLSGD